jgi:outer membrane lipoprotein LolB
MIKHLTLTILVLCLTGCMQQPRATAIVSKQARLQCLQQMQVWQAEGRVSIQNKQQAQTASYKWQQNYQNYRAYFYSPFSNQSLTLSGNATEVKVESVQGMSADEIELEQNLPLAQLGYWAKGMPAPNSQPQLAQYDACNQLQKLQQDGWTVEYQSYAPGESISLPEKIAMQKEQIKVKLTIKR